MCGFVAEFWRRASAGECENRVAHVVLDQVGVDGHGGGGSFPGGRNDLGARVGDVACHPHAGDARQPVTVGDGPSLLVERAAEAGEQAAVGDESGWDEQRVTGDGAVAVELDAAEAVALDEDSLRGPFDDRDPPGGQLVTLGCRQGPGRRDVHDVAGPLADDLGISDRRGRAAQHAELPVSHLEAVTVGAMQHVAGPTRTQARDVGNLIAQARRNEEPPRRERPALAQTTRKNAPSLTIPVALPGMTTTP